MDICDEIWFTASAMVCVNIDDRGPLFSKIFKYAATNVSIAPHVHFVDDPL